jgi:formylglycine-generating enzyme required for sulfatase activity
MALLHYSWGQLPEDRVKLYKEMVELLLVRWQARLAEDMSVAQKMSAADLESALEQAAFVAHRAQEGPEGTADVSEAELRYVLQDYLDGNWNKAGDLLGFIQQRSGLLKEREPGVYTLPHRSYQQYLAGSYLAVQPDYPDQATDLVRENYAQWREVVLWAIGVTARLKKMVYVAVDVVAALCPHEVPDRVVSEADWQIAHLAGEALLEIGIKKVKARVRHKRVIDRVQGWLVALIERSALTPVDRAAAGQFLARLGDPRPGVCTLPLAWVKIPAGPFTMGSREDARLACGNEHPQHKVNVNWDYCISRYPITNAQYELFVEAGGYRKQRYWTKAGWEWKGDKMEPSRPRLPFNLSNHPVVRLSWYEAVAFCRWLTGHLRAQGEISKDREVRLPSEAEWEKAARGTDGREWPWGDEFDPTMCNISETGIGATGTADIYPVGAESGVLGTTNTIDVLPAQTGSHRAVRTTSAVGIFPAGASPYGVLDMAGNVREWTCSLWGKEFSNPDYEYPYLTDNGREKLELENDADFRRVTRGGAFNCDAQDVRCAHRHRSRPLHTRYDNFGFRVVLCPSSRTCPT